MRQPLNLIRKGQRGAVIVEFAMILPLLMFMLVGIVDFGLIIREHQILQNAAREGARLSILKDYSLATSANPTVTAATIKARVVDYLAQEGITISDTNVSIDQNVLIDFGGIFGTGSRITVTYVRPLLIGNGWPFGPASLTGISLFRNLY